MIENDFIIFLVINTILINGTILVLRFNINKNNKRI